MVARPRMNGHGPPDGNTIVSPQLRRASSTGTTGAISATAAADHVQVTTLGTCAPGASVMAIEPLVVGVVEMVTSGVVHACGFQMLAVAVHPVRFTSVAMAGGGEPVCHRTDPACAAPE